MDPGSPEDDPQIGPDPWTLSRNQWLDVFAQGPHTSFKIIEVLLGELNLTYGDLLANPACLQPFSDNWRDWVTNVFDDPWIRTWDYDTGRCTSFAIKVAYGLESHPDYRGVFDFKYYNLGRHRVARCDRTTVVIDSESKYGPRLLPENAEWTDTPGEHRGWWRYHNGVSIFEERRSGGPRGTGTLRHILPITREEALGICLKEITDMAVLVCLFRSIRPLEQGSQPWVAQYHGVVRWRISERRIELTPDLDRRDSFYCITFGRPGGSRETNRQCINNFVAFIRDCGIEQQWRADGINQFNQELWKAAIQVWGGFPVWSERLT
ncbi:hypothetical protein B0H66DRAFT_356961 [Apodospora peruviana]|uniref:Uncharacterized protein n=1 Tax=Apodospora peruviana TaxID=516989 RepID=A0AAE0M0F8_9PEZI|nr:hypothetical protein B0H66DRAFT_356961 [Apodospora peruviana]